MYEFSYHKPASVADAVKLLAADPEARPVSGGMTLLPALKLRLSKPTALVDLSGIAELRGVKREGETIVIGALTKHYEVATSAAIKAAIPALAAMAATIGDTQVRNRGTMGGSIANNDPSADYPAALLALGATIQTDRRKMSADDFFQGMFATALEPDELIVAIRFACPRRAAYAKFAHPASGYAMTGVFVAEFDDEIRVAVTGAGPGVFRWREAENALRARPEAATLDGLTMPADGLNADLHAPAAYRASLVRLMTQQAVAGLAGPV